MFTVYVLHSPNHDKIYIGYTSDIGKRLASHNHLATKGFTIKFRPWVVIHTENFELKSDAIRREKQLKGAAGRTFIRSLIPKL